MGVCVLCPVSGERLLKTIRTLLRHVRWRRLFVRVVAAWLVISLVMGVVVHTVGYTDNAQPADVIIVLGAGLNRNNTPSPAHRSRSYRAADLWAQGFAPTIICTGGLPGWATRSEADACRELLVSRGVPEDAIVLEARSRSTEENALYSREIMTANGWQTAVVVSDRYHLLRANWLFSNAGITAYMSPASVSAFTVPRYAIQVAREVVALQWQAFSDFFNLPFTYVPLV